MRSPVANVRSLLSGLFFLAYGLAALPFALLLMLPGWTPRMTRRIVRLFYRLFVFFGRLTRLFDLQYDEPTRTALSACRGRVVVMNHLSLVDVCMLIATLPDSTAIVKSATLRNPFLGMVVRRAFIPNTDDPERVTERVCRALNAGVNVIVFPEGTRRAPGDARPLRRGAARLALAAGVPIACFHIDYEPIALAKGQPWWDVGSHMISVRLRACGEIPVSGPSTHAAAVALTETLRERLMLD